MRLYKKLAVLTLVVFVTVSSGAHFSVGRMLHIGHENDAQMTLLTPY
jgi:hypothetical protein